MKIKEISVEVLKSRNYQTYKAGEVIIIEEDDDIELQRKTAMARCRKAVMEQIALDTPKI